MHHKYAVIDRKTVITGSFNWTGNGEYPNKENVLILESPTLAARYLQNFDTIPCEDQPPPDKPPGASGQAAHISEEE